MNKILFDIRDSEVRFFGALTILLLAILGVSLLVGSRGVKEEEPLPAELAQKAFPELRIVAHSAYVYDVRNKSVLYAKNENDSLPLASVTKLMSALVAAKYGEPFDTIVVDEEALRSMGDSGLALNERWSLKSIIDFALLTSSNDGMAAVALTLGSRPLGATSTEALKSFASMMNREAVVLGLESSYFRNATGLDESESEAGAYGSAKDVTKILEYLLLYYPETLEATKETNLVVRSNDGRNHLAKNTNKITGSIPGLLASKTGYTTLAGGNLVVIFDPDMGRPIIVTVLGSTLEGRFADMEELVKATMTYIVE